MQAIHVTAICDSASEAQHVVALLGQMTSAPRVTLDELPAPATKQLAAPVEKPAETKPAETKPAETKPAETTTAPPSEPAAALTVETVKARFFAYYQKHGADAAKGKLAAHGVSKASDLKPEQFAAFVESLGRES